MSRDTNGVALVGRILARVAAREPCTAADLARDLGASRTTVFSVLRDLEASGLVERDACGLVSPGPASGALAFARFGLGALAAPAEALLPVLRDETNARVALVVRHEGSETVLARRSPAGAAPAPREDSDGTRPLEAALDVDCSDAILRLHLGSNADAAARELARTSLDIVAAALSRSVMLGRVNDDAL